MPNNPEGSVDPPEVAEPIPKEPSPATTGSQSPQGFTAETFALLSQLAENPNVEFYSPRREDFRRAVQDPFHVVFDQIVARLPAAITDRMETTSRLYSRFVKNDYGRGGAWPYYWAAIYEGPDRINGVQLFAWINHDRLVFGFSIGEYASEFTSSLRENGSRELEILRSLLDESLSNPDFHFGRNSENLEASDLSWTAWITSTTVNSTCGRVIDAESVLNATTNGLVELGVAVFTTLFPLVLIATEADPIPAIAAYLDSEEIGQPINPTYALDQCAADLGLPEALLGRWVRAINRHGQAIIFGPPGTGKTYTARRLARHMIGGGDGFMDLVQFHPAYGYEDFVQGMRPKGRDDGGGLDYPIVHGRFRDFCEEAQRRTGPSVLIIDEINRANLSRVFGELMYLLEYRDATAEGGERVTVPLAAGERFGIPLNVRIVGTMNTADRSIALVDHALRRRFAFLELFPDYDVLAKFHADTGFPVDKLIVVLRDLNAKIADRHYAVGISYFLHEELELDIEDIWIMQIVPYLDEYFFDDPSKVDPYRWSAVRDRIF